MTLSEIVEQLELCNYTCEGGDLKDNVAFIELKRLACDTAMAEVERLKAKWAALREDRSKWPQALLEGVDALESQYDCEMVDVQHHAIWVDRCEAALAESDRLRAHATGIGEKVKKVCMKAAMKWRQDRNNGRTGQGVDIYIDAAVDVAALLAGDDAETSWPPGFIPCSEPNCERAYAATRKAAERVATGYLGVRCNSCNQATVTKGHLLSEGEWAEKEAAYREGLKAAPGGQSE